MGQHGQRLNTGTCFSVSSDDKLVLFLFPRIPTGDPAIVAFYDKRIYKKLCHDTPPHSFMTIEGWLCGVRTVINILHFFKPISCIYMYHMKTGVFQTD